MNTEIKKTPIVLGRVEPYDVQADNARAEGHEVPSADPRTRAPRREEDLDGDGRPGYARAARPARAAPPPPWDGTGLDPDATGDDGTPFLPPALTEAQIREEEAAATPLPPELAGVLEKVAAAPPGALADLHALAVEVHAFNVGRERERTQIETRATVERLRDRLAAGDLAAAHPLATAIEAAQRLEAPRSVATPASPPAIASAWGPLDLATLTDAPAARRWLLRHPTRDGQRCAPTTGDGMLPLGKVGLLVADGGVGKTMTLFGLAVSIITGRPWLGHYEIGHEARKGRVLLALAEEDREEVHRRLFALGRAYNLDAAEHARIAERLVVLPLAGKPVSLLGYGHDGRSLVASEELHALREKLVAEAGAEGWSLVALDPLARWGADDMEKDNAVATRTLQAVETLLEVPGRPTVLLAHHTSEMGARVGAPRARGATGIRNGARWEAVLREEGPDVYFKQTKSNYSRPMHGELRLVRGPGGLLRVPSEEQEQEHQERVAERQETKDAAKDARREARVLAVMEAMLAEVRAATEPITSRAQIVGLVKGDKTVRESALSRLLASGRIKPEPLEGKRGNVYTAPDLAPTP